VIGIERRPLSPRGNTRTSRRAAGPANRIGGRAFIPRQTRGSRHGWYGRSSSSLCWKNGRPTRSFVPARVGDNTFNNPDYRKVLEGLTGWQKRAWLDGDWDIAAGQFFTMFRRDVQVVEDFDDKRRWNGSRVGLRVRALHGLPAWVSRRRWQHVHRG